MAASATITATLPPQQGDFAAASAAVAAPSAAITLLPQQGTFAAAPAVPVVPGSGHHAARASAEPAASTLQATPTREAPETAVSTQAAAAAATAADAATVATADVSADVSADVLDAQVTSETVNSTLMGIALLAYLQGSAAKREATGASGGHGSSGAPSSSKGGLAAARPGAGAVAARAGAHPNERLPPRRPYQRMSPAYVDASVEPLTRTLAAIKASNQSKAEYTCKRVLSSSTYLHRVHVNAAMSSNLLPDYGRGSRGGGGRSPPRDDENARRNPGTAPTCRKPNTVIFRRRVRMLDERDREWLITYESLCSAGQRHTRFSAGWAALCKANDFKVGVTIVFSRWGKRDGGVVVVARENGAL